MQSATQAYGAVAKQTASPRDLEATLLMQAANRLQNVHDDWSDQRDALDRALLFNRKLWTIFMTSVTRNDNPLPPEIRQNVANIGVFVLKQTLAMMVNPRPEQLNSLININRALAAGLRGKAA